MFFVVVLPGKSYPKVIAAPKEGLWEILREQIQETLGREAEPAIH